jgi:hypothetical protein
MNQWMNFMTSPIPWMTLVCAYLWLSAPPIRRTKWATHGRRIVAILFVSGLTCVVAAIAIHKRIERLHARTLFVD